MRLILPTPTAVKRGVVRLSLSVCLFALYIGKTAEDISTKLGPQLLLGTSFILKVKRQVNYRVKKVTFQLCAL